VTRPSLYVAVFTKTFSKSSHTLRLRRSDLEGDEAADESDYPKPRSPCFRRERARHRAAKPPSR
jgi:hypothetical protein